MYPSRNRGCKLESHDHVYATRESEIRSRGGMRERRAFRERCVRLAGSWQIRWHPESPLRRRAAVLAAQAAAVGFLVLLIARAAEPELESHDPGGRGRHIRRRERHPAEKGRRNGAAGHSAENSGASAGLQIQFGLLRQVFSSRDGGGEFGGRYASGERGQVRGRVA